MTAEVIMLPVIRKLSAPAPQLPCDCEPSNEPSITRVRKPELFELIKGPLPANTQIPYEIALDFALADKLEDAAELAGIDTETLLRRLVEWSINQIEKMPEGELVSSLTASA